VTFAEPRPLRFQRGQTIGMPVENFGIAKGTSVVRWIRPDRMKIWPGLLICLGVLAAPPAHADIYAYTGANGVIHLTNVPQKQKPYRMVMRTPKVTATILPQPAANPMAQKELQPIVDRAAERFGVSAALINAVIRAESGFNSGAVSPKGAMGLMQLMPTTASRFGVSNAFSPKENIKGGTAYLAHLIKRFGGDLKLAIAAYNSGPQAVVQAGYTVLPYRETQNYVPRVLAYYQQFASGQGSVVGSGAASPPARGPQIIRLSSP